MKNYVIGIDVGGTNIKLGIINSKGRIVSRASFSTGKYAERRSRLISALAEAIKELLEDTCLDFKDILGVGIGLPGLIDPHRGIVNFLPNIQGWKNVPLKKVMEEKLGVPVFLDNDVNLVTLGEWKFGAGRGYNNLLCMTLGTGIGGGLVLNGELYRGEGFVAGEIGHMPLNEKGPVCNCGGYACFERYVGNRILQEKAAKIFKNKRIQLEDVFELTKAGNVRAAQFWDEVASHIGNGLVGIVNILNPRLIIIGGGVANSYRFMINAINKIVKNRSMSVQAKMVKIARAKLGNDAGIIGAYVLVKEYGNKR